MSSRALILDINSCRLPQTKDIIFMRMNPNVCPLYVYTQKKSLEVTLNHKPNSPFVFTSKDPVQHWTKHVETHHKNIYFFLSSCQKWKPSPSECSISSLPFNCPMWFRITLESYTMVFRPKNIEQGCGSGKGFLPFLSTGDGSMAQKLENRWNITDSTVLSEVVATYRPFLCCGHSVSGHLKHFVYAQLTSISL